MGILISLTRQIIFLIPLILIFPAIWGIDGVMYAGPIADAAALLDARRCGVQVLCSAHAAGFAQAKRRPALEPLLRAGVCQQAIIMGDERLPSEAEFCRRPRRIHRRGKTLPARATLHHQHDQGGRLQDRHAPGQPHAGAPGDPLHVSADHQGRDRSAAPFSAYACRKT